MPWALDTLRGFSRWTTGYNISPPKSCLQARPQSLAANSPGMEGSRFMPSGEALHFTAFYFPGWRVFLDGKAGLRLIRPPTWLSTVDVSAATMS